MKKILAIIGSPRKGETYKWFNMWRLNAEVCKASNQKISSIGLKMDGLKRLTIPM